jgi:hypothetical protein
VPLRDAHRLRHGSSGAVAERVRLRQRGQGAATSRDVDMRLEA